MPHRFLGIIQAFAERGHGRLGVAVERPQADHDAGAKGRIAVLQGADQGMHVHACGPADALERGRGGGTDGRIRLGLLGQLGEREIGSAGQWSADVAKRFVEFAHRVLCTVK